MYGFGWRICVGSTARILWAATLQCAQDKNGKEMPPNSDTFVDKGLITLVLFPVDQYRDFTEFFGCSCPVPYDRSNWSNVKPLSITDNIPFGSSKTPCEQVSTRWRRATSSAAQALKRLRCISVVVKYHRNKRQHGHRLEDNRGPHPERLPLGYCRETCFSSTRQLLCPGSLSFTTLITW